MLSGGDAVVAGHPSWNRWPESLRGQLHRLEGRMTESEMSEAVPLSDRHLGRSKPFIAGYNFLAVILATCSVESSIWPLSPDCLQVIHYSHG